jgi:rare lipoprotein A
MLASAVAALSVALAGAAIGDTGRLANGRAHHRLPPRQVGKASFYRATGARTASGRRFNPGAMTAASRTLPLGTRAKVTNLESGRQVHVTVNDRGPYSGGRVLDVSPAAADRLGMRKTGVARVEIRPVSVPAADPRHR